jgi:hypothetical protein
MGRQNRRQSSFYRQANKISALLAPNMIPQHSDNNLVIRAWHSTNASEL